MSTGAAMWISLIAFLIVWGAIDWYIWHAWDGETATRWFIKVSKKHRWVAWLYLAAIVAGAITLILHLEIPDHL